LAAIWLPLTMHCQLAGLKRCNEAAGVCGNHCGCNGGDDHQSDVCTIIETGKYLWDKTTLAIPAAAFEGLALLEAMDGRCLLTPAGSINEATGAPPGWGRVWQFVWRAAHAPRAPSAVC